jgi:glutamate-1-semialdehyde 2,1-aminomutase
MKRISKQTLPDRYARSLAIIPGGTQLFSKKPEIFSPADWPVFFSKAKGVRITDHQGNHFIDMSQMGVGACILGYADPDVNRAVKKVISKGVQSTLIAIEELELAEELIAIHPWSQMVRFARSGGEAISIAIRIARASTGKDVVLFSGYHGWNDWYLAANLADGDSLGEHLLPGLSARGVPYGLRGSAVPFRFNNVTEFDEAIRANAGKVAAVIMEPRRSEKPLPGYMEHVKESCTKNGAALIYDEITTGWRANEGGIHLQDTVFPDLAVFAKSMANGFAMSAIIGTSEIMQYANTTFISSTNWTERVGPVAALATIKKYRKYDVSKHLADCGRLVSDGWIRIGEENGLLIEADHQGLPALSHFSFEYDFARGMNITFTSLMIKKGWLTHNQFKPSFAHDHKIIDRYLFDCNEVFGEIKKLLDRESRIFSELSEKFPAPTIPRLTK